MKRKLAFLLAISALALSVAALWTQVLAPGRTGEQGGGKEPSLLGNLFADPEAAYQEAQALYDAGDLYGALERLSQAEENEKTENYQNLLSACNSQAAEENMTAAQEAVKQADYASAQAALDRVYQYQPERRAETEKLYQTCVDFQNLEDYQGPVEHIFFHPLIAYPELAFDGDSQSKGFDDYFVTVPEFKEVMRQFYENGYVLIDIHLLYEVDENGVAQKPETLMLPAGKKPLVLSIDDLNFYQYMRANGMAHGFALDETGKLVTYTDDEAGNRTYSDDNAIPPILEKFVEEHPDFSYGGQKGMICSTGYEGTLGFPTDLMDDPNYPQTLAEAKAIADKLKDMGWCFASHSYGHNSPSKRSYEKIAADNDKWLKEAVPVLGETDIYVYPYGELIDPSDPKHQHMLENGFKFFCGVQSRSPYIKYRGENGVLMQRRNIDGISLKSDRLDDLLDTSTILDPCRPQ